jgi:uncharacterized protein with HEPN domain
MSQHDDAPRLRHVLDNARHAIRFGLGKSGDEIAADELLGTALVRFLEVIGEAASRVSLKLAQALQASHGERPLTCATA